jgi:hypothetical protein
LPQAGIENWLAVTAIEGEFSIFILDSNFHGATVKERLLFEKIAVVMVLCGVEVVDEFAFDIR